MVVELVAESGRVIGSTPSHFRIVAKLGEGGMGEVYRAEDTKLGREVAIKVLPEAFVADPQRLARFEREAHLLASVSHPNIAAVFELAEHEGTHLLVQELVEGEDLAVHLARGPLPVVEALALARQLAEALEAAHERGIVHRDLKPQNLKIMPDGRLKVLDFGLAKAWEPKTDAVDLTRSRTLTEQMTGAGVILGTAAYMSPEQARGLEVDKQTDIWAFGVVLHEMLTGKRLFTGETMHETLAGVLTEEVDLEALPVETPAAIRRLLRRCLERSPRDRLHDIADARIVLDETLAGGADEKQPTGETAVAPAGSWWRVVPWLVAALALVAAVLTWSAGRREAPPATSIVASLPPPPGTSYYLRSTNPAPATLSHDGSRLVFGAVDANSVAQLYVRDLATGVQLALAGTEGAQYPFWSADDRWIGFFSRREQSLRKIPATGGTPITICRAVDGKGGSWNDDGVILFSPNPGAPIYRVAAEREGDPEPVTELEDERYNSHRHPRFLPDGRHFLFLARSQQGEESTVMLGDLEDGGFRALLKSPSHAEYASGHLLFVREGTLLAQPFDEKALDLSATALSVATGVRGWENTALSLFSGSRSGSLVIHRGSVLRPVQLELRDRAGSLLERLATPHAGFRDMEFSPRGNRIAYSTSEASQDIFILDLVRGTEQRFTLESSEDVWPAWGPDGETLYFGANRQGPHNIFRKVVGGSAPAELVADVEGTAVPAAVSPDGRTLLYLRYFPDHRELWRHDLSGGEDDRRLDLPVFGSRSAFSPDGRWLVFVGLEDGQPQILATPYPGPGRIFPVSTGGGAIPFWTEDGREILYLSLDGRVVAVQVDTAGSTLVLGAPRVLFEAIPPALGFRNFAVSPDGKRFLLVPDAAFGAENELEIVTHWPSRLGRP